MTYLAESPTTPPNRKRWTRDDCTFLENSGLLKDRYELLNGEIVIRMGQNRPHALTLSLAFHYVDGVFGPRRIQTQATMEVHASQQVTNRPEPDILVLREEFTSTRTPTGTDVLLIIEVCDTTQADDFGTKPRLYARAGVAEYWVLDINRRLLVQFRQPLGDEWQERNEFTDTGNVSCLAAPNATVLVANLLP